METPPGANVPWAPWNEPPGLDAYYEQLEREERQRQLDDQEDPCQTPPPPPR